MAQLVELHDDGSRPLRRLNGDGSMATTDPLDTLVYLVVDLEATWHGMEEAARLAELSRIEGVVASLQVLAGSHPSPARTVPLVGLTLRERQVLGLLVEGTSTAGMAKRLGISTATIRSHVKSLLAKLGVHSRIEAVALIRRGTEASSFLPQDADPEAGSPVTASSLLG
jgi:DNA-binding CsgD family transcriptional regulator